MFKKMARGSYRKNPKKFFKGRYCARLDRSDIEHLKLNIIYIYLKTNIKHKTFNSYLAR